MRSDTKTWNKIDTTMNVTNIIVTYSIEINQSDKWVKFKKVLIVKKHTI